MCIAFVHSVVFLCRFAIVINEIIKDMKRQTKFMGISIITNKWVYGYFGGKLNPANAEDQYYIIEPTYNPATDRSYFTDIEIIPGTECQYTGLKDEKGREIYEDDIYFDEIEEDDGDVRLYYVCKWINEWARFVWLHLPGELQDYEDNGVDHFIENEFVMETERMHYAGNIHQNPELLTK